MNSKSKKLVALILAIVLAFCGVSAFAEDAVQTILNAKTTQAFTHDPVPDEDLNTILTAGTSATSAINQQPWFFAVVTNQEIMEEIAGAGFGGMPSGMPAGGKPEGMPEGFTPPEGASLPEGIPAMPDNGMPTGGKPEGIPEGFTPPEGASLPEGMPAMPGNGMPQGVPGAGSGSAKAALGDSPVAVLVYMNENSSSPNASFDCGLACQNMVIAANALGYGTKIISSPTMSLNGENHDALCEKLGVDPSLSAVAVLLIGIADTEVDGATGATTRSAIEEKVNFVK